MVKPIYEECSHSEWCTICKENNCNSKPIKQRSVSGDKITHEPDQIQIHFLNNSSSIGQQSDDTSIDDSLVDFYNSNEEKDVIQEHGNIPSNPVSENIFCIRCAGELYNECAELIKPMELEFECPTSDRHGCYTAISG